MKLRSTQVDAFTEARSGQFEDYMIGHLRRFFPGQCQGLNDDQLRRRIRSAMKRAERYDIVGQRDLADFIDLDMAWGEGFDENPSLPWAQQTLSDSGLNPSMKVARLGEQAEEHRRALLRD